MRMKMLRLIILGLLVALSASSAHAQAPAVRTIAKFPEYIGFVRRLALSLEAEIASTRLFQRRLARELTEWNAAAREHPRTFDQEVDRLRRLGMLERLTPNQDVDRWRRLGMSKDEIVERLSIDQRGNVVLRPLTRDELLERLSTDQRGNIVLRPRRTDDHLPQAKREVLAAAKSASTAENPAKSDAPKIKFSLDGKLKIGTLKTFGNYLEIEGGEYNLYLLGAGAGVAGFCGKSECYKAAARFIIEEAVKAKEVREMVDRIEKAKKPSVEAD